jgi:NAD(P)H-flavin reductase
MTQQVYRAYCDSLAKDEPLPANAMDESFQEFQTFTVKNYKQGMSSSFFYNAQTVYEIKGPMGKGLLTKPSGLHVAFAAGTGVLTFMDTVAFASRVAMQKVQGEQPVPPEFELVLYVSFNSRESSIGLELLTALDEYCKRHNLSTFRLVTRISQEQTGENRSRWDEKHIRGELGKMNNIQQVFVCGTPLISEIFDKAFGRIASDCFNGLSKDKLHVL